MPSPSDPESLHLLIIGAGLAGLAAAITTRLAGHNVTILEKVSQLQEIGAGLQVTPNATRVLRHWGLYDTLEPLAAKPATLSVWRYDGTKLLARAEAFQEQMGERYGAPFWGLHRADLQSALATRAEAVGVEVRLGVEVVSLDADADGASVMLADGERVTGDVLLAADGLWSKCREQFLDHACAPQPTGDLAYRIILDLEDIRDEELRAWVSRPTVNFWIGPCAHAVGYSVRNGRQFNLVLLQPDDLSEDVRKAEGNVREMREIFAKWDPILNKFLDQVKAVDKWKLMHLSELDSWKNAAGTFVLAGDSCHPMLPYLAQGANSALEDGAVLGRLLGHVRTRSQIGEATELYQSLRKVRGEAIARETFKQRADFHMQDGSEQRKRDEVFLACLGKEPIADFPSRWTCPVVQPWLYGYDAIAEADRAWENRGTS